MVLINHITMKVMKVNYRFLIIFILLGTISLMVTAEIPKVIAHRGFWRTEGSAQNSIRALIKADSIGCYASELDVWISADSVLIVNHDAGINGITIETSQSKDILTQKLQNGENVPTFESYLAEAAKLSIRLVCEIKTHNNRSLEKCAIEKILESVDKYNLNDKVDYITFSKDSFKNFINLSPPSTNVYYLEGDYIPDQVLFEGGRGIDYQLGILKKYPEWIEESHKLGLLVNVWTVDSVEDMEWCISQGVDFITTNEPEKLQNLIKEY